MALRLGEKASRLALLPPQITLMGSPTQNTSPLLGAPRTKVAQSGAQPEPWFSTVNPSRATCFARSVGPASGRAGACPGLVRRVPGVGTWFWGDPKRILSVNPGPNSALIQDSVLGTGGTLYSLLLSDKNVSLQPLPAIARPSVVEPGVNSSLFPAPRLKIH